jgi:hypothetical protein
MGKRGQDPLVSLAQVIGFSLSLIILGAEFGFFLGVRFSSLIIILLLVISASLAVSGILKNGVKLSKKRLVNLIIGLIIFGLALTWRFYQARDLLLPNWVDSQHHYLIIKVILENGTIPETLSPYLEGPFYYHFGYHAVAALFTGLSRLPIGDAMLILGQFINAAVGLSVYALGKALWRDWQPAAAAGLLVTFVTRMPAYYLSWGRYTLLTGLVLLPLAIGLALQILRKSQRQRDVFSLALLTGGLLLSHYFGAALLASFLVIITVTYFLPRLNKFSKAVKRLIPLVSGGFGGLLLAAPWLWRVLEFYPNQASVDANLPETLDGLFNAGDGSYLWQLLGPASNHWLLLAAGVGLIIGLIRKKKMSFGVWSLLIALMSLPWGITIKPFRPDHFVIISFLPVGLWAGYGIWQAAGLLAKRFGKGWISPLLMLLAVGGWFGWSFPFSSDIVNPVTVLVTAEDIKALNWIRENTPEDARFYINTTHWQSGVYRGVDGGGWILPYTGRWALVPTVFYGFSPDKEQNQQLRDWGEAASEITTCSEEFWRIVEEADLDYVYIRKGIGSLQEEGLAGCEGVENIYRNRSIGIWKFTD